MTNLGRVAPVLVAILSLSACGSGDDGGDGAEPRARAEGLAEGDQTGAAGMPGLEATQGDLVDEMEAGMQMMASMRADSMMSMLPTHARLLADMIARMSQDMAATHAPGDAAWTATVDSLRNDLLRMSAMGDEALKAFMPTHQERVTRLIRMHRSMTAPM